MSIKNILLVEDNPDDRELMTLAFSQEGIPHKLVVVSDGIEALNYLLGKDNFPNQRSTSLNQENLPSMPALIMLDLNLPKIDGIEVLRRIRAHPQTKLIPVVIISSSNEPQDLINSCRVGRHTSPYPSPQRTVRDSFPSYGSSSFSSV